MAYNPLPGAVVIWEPDVLQADYLVFGFREAGWQTQHFSRWQDFISALEAHTQSPVAIVLALGQDIEKSLRHCQRLRQRLPLASLVLLSHHQISFSDTASLEELAFQAGADDYLLKPLELNRLIWRTQAHLLRIRQIISALAQTEGPEPAVFGPLRLEPAQRRVFVEQRSFQLGLLEFQLLQALCGAGDAGLSREQLLLRLWQAQAPTHSVKLNHLVSRLRKKISPEVQIQGRYGLGYALSWSV